MKQIALILLAILDCLLILDVLQGAVWSANGPILQGYVAGLLHLTGFVATFVAGRLSA